MSLEEEIKSLLPKYFYGSAYRGYEVTTSRRGILIKMLGNFTNIQTRLPYKLLEGVVAVDFDKTINNLGRLYNFINLLNSKGINCDMGYITLGRVHTNWYPVKIELNYTYNRELLGIFSQILDKFCTMYKVSRLVATQNHIRVYNEYSKVVKDGDVVGRYCYSYRYYNDYRGICLTRCYDKSDAEIIYKHGLEGRVHTLLAELGKTSLASAVVKLDVVALKGGKITVSSIEVKDIVVGTTLTLAQVRVIKNKFKEYINRVNSLGIFKHKINKMCVDFSMGFNNSIDMCIVMHSHRDNQDYVVYFNSVMGYVRGCKELGGCLSFLDLVTFFSSLGLWFSRVEVNKTSKLEYSIKVLSDELLSIKRELEVL